jgi:SIR2-like domain
MSPPPTASDISVQDTLALLDGGFADFSAGVAADRYAIWLGSGISLSKMPGLASLAEAVIEHLRTRVDPGDANCTFRTSLETILGLVILTPDQRNALDFSQPFATWADRAVISQSLVSNYAQMLDQAPVGKPADYLLWEAVQVVQRYASPAITPAAEHLALAALVVEGVASDIASANWDGLLEKAVLRLVGAVPGVLQVRIRPEDVRADATRSRLYKFHGCAVLAGQNEPVYRPRLVGRISQLDEWAAQNAVIGAKLTDLIVSKPTLMLGLSAQDTNIRRMFVDARQQMPWMYPSSPPAFVFSEEQIGTTQRNVLQNQYPTQYEGHRQAIDTSALLRAYGASLLPALWLHVVCAKLSALIDGAAANLSAAERQSLRDGLKTLRDAGAVAAEGVDREAYMDQALTHAGRVMALLRRGRVPTDAEGIYGPVSATPVTVLANDVDVAVSGLPEFAVGAALLGHGLAQAAWGCTTPVAATQKSGAVSVDGARAAELFFAASPRAAAQLFAEGHVDENDDAVIVHSAPIVEPTRRSPNATFGRVGRVGLRQVSVRTLVDEAANLPALVTRFRLELAL